MQGFQIVVVIVDGTFVTIEETGIHQIFKGYFKNLYSSVIYFTN